jgi:hypothetical protein
MKVYKTIEEVNADVKDGVLKVSEYARFEFNLDIDASIIVDGNIDAWDINVRDIHARDIYARDINAINIKARNISYHAVAFAYKSFMCREIEGRRKNSKYFCLDSAVIVNGKKEESNG